MTESPCPLAVITAHGLFGWKIVVYTGDHYEPDFFPDLRLYPTLASARREAARRVYTPAVVRRPAAWLPPWRRRYRKSDGLIWPPDRGE